MPNPPKRRRPPSDDDSADENIGLPNTEFNVQNKRTRSVIDEALATLVCPLTKALPLDPVTAEDGNVYERSAIEEWLGQQHCSPVTNELMGLTLREAVRHKNMIRGLISTIVGSGSQPRTGSPTAAWRARMQAEEAVEEQRSRAKAGDADAMVQLAVWHAEGAMGLARDRAQTFVWAKKSHEAGCAAGTVLLAQCHLCGWGTPQNTMMGALQLATAATLGSRSACYCLGHAFSEGKHGMPQDAEQARQWYAKIPSCPLADLEADKADEAAAWLRDHAA